MARTNIVATALSVVGSYPTAGQISGDTMVPSLTSTSDPTDRVTALIDSKTMVIAHNSDSGSHTITITSVLDTPFNRSGDIVQNLEADEIWVFGPIKASGWAQTGNLLFIDVSDPKVQIAILTLP